MIGGDGSGVHFAAVDWFPCPCILRHPAQIRFWIQSGVKITSRTTQRRRLAVSDNNPGPP